MCVCWWLGRCTCGDVNVCRRLCLLPAITVLAAAVAWCKLRTHARSTRRVQLFLGAIETSAAAVAANSRENLTDNVETMFEKKTKHPGAPGWHNVCGGHVIQWQTLFRFGGRSCGAGMILYSE